jgi:hypothetical protein
MKKIIALISLIALLLGMFEIANAQLSVGQTGEDVSNLQEVLKEDPEIYPEGYVTGYFGKLTEKAVKKLQKRCGLPETGIVDEQTLKCIFPEIEITVISPNGGENWDRTQIQTIKWSATTTLQEVKTERYLWKKGSIDLFRRVTVGTTTKSVFVKHVANVDLFDGIYSWRITPDIPSGSDYVIRISAGKRIVPLIRAERMKKVSPPEEIWPTPPVPPWTLSFDESDGTFTITGQAAQPDLSEVIKILEEINRDLERITANLKKVMELLGRIKP